MNISNVSLYSSYSPISSTSQITTVASNPSGIAIGEKLESQVVGLTQEINNNKSSQNLYSIADGAYKSINDNLQRMRELSLRASSGILSDSDKSIIQNEINQIKECINQTIKNTEFNGIKILDGGAPDSFGINQISLDNLGIKNFDVTGNFSIQDIDNAINTINQNRSQIGASFNVLSYSVSNKENYRLNLTNSLNTIKGKDYYKEINEMKIETILQQYRLKIQEKELEQQQSKLNFFI